MGRPVARNLEDEMMTKIKALFDRILDTVNKENPQYTFDFEQFVDCFDENDHFTKRVFEFLVKETAQRYRSAHPQPQHSSHPRATIHHLPGGGQDTRSTTGATAIASNASASAGTGAGAAGGGESTGGSSAPSATTLRQHHHHHHHHSPFQSSRHSLPPLERDSLARSPSTPAGFGSTNENAQATAPSTSSSGAALRYLLSSQGFGQNSRRSRAAQRMLSNDLMAFHQGQPSLFSSLSALSSPVLGPDTMLASTSRGPSSTTTVTRRHTQDMDTSLPISSAPPMGSSSGAAAGASSSSASGSASAAASSTSLRVRSPFEQIQDRQDRLRRYMPLREFSMELMPESFRSTDSNASGSSFLLSDDLEPTTDPTVARASSSSQRRRVIVAENMRQAREQQIRQLYAQTLRARPPPAQLSSTQTSSSQAQSSSSQVSSSSSEPSNQFRQHYIQQLQEQRARRQFDQLRQLEHSQHAHQQALQALQGQRLVAPEDTQQLSSSPQQDQPQSSTQSLAQRYVLQDNGLRLVQPYPGSPGTPIPLSSTASDSMATGGLTSQSTGSLSALTSQQVLDEAYQEFSSSTERGRAAMRNALAADLHIEEDHQVLLTGEVSRRRRRRVVGRFSNSMGSPDIGSDNSSAIISQQQQQQEQREQESRESAAASTAVTPTDSVPRLPPTSSTTVLQTQNAEQQQVGAGPVIHATLPTGSITATPSAATTDLTTTAAPTVPEVSVEMVDSQSIRDDAEHNGGSDSSNGSSSSISGHLGLGLTSTGSTSHGQSVPPTPPSPNPNRNPMPTFQDRRRSSINPADIETLVREMEANAQSAAALGIRTTGGSSRPTSSSSPRIRFPLHALSPIVEPGGSTPPVALVPPLGIITPSSNSSLTEPTESASLATQQPVLLSPESERGAERISGPRSPPLQ